MKTKKRSYFAAVLALVLALGTTPVAQARTSEDLYDYYNTSWTVISGYRYFYCDDTTDWWGYPSSARVWTHTDCATGTGWTKCQIYYGGVWYDVSCPF